ncbi:MAG: TIM barrel protein [Anaerolineales bacterium]|nr:TIM barrel protein [Anaerolineales bacterium]
MSRSLHLDLGLSAVFAARQWAEPETWLRLTRELGYPWLEFSGDALDPFFSGDLAYQMQTAQQICTAAEKYNVRIPNAYTGKATHRFHGLSHPDESVRSRMRDWIVTYMDLALAMGTDRIGGRWNTIPTEECADPARYAEAKALIHRQFRELAMIAKDKGLAAIYNEQMYIPAEYPWTIESTYEFLEAVNRDSQGVPIYLTIDTGHMAGMHYGAAGDDLDYRAWLRHFAPVCENVHLQQTTPTTSSHWPFTAAYNTKGHVRVEEVLAAIRRGYAAWPDNPLSKFMTPVRQTILVIEVIPGSTARPEILLADLRESAQHVRQFVPEGGLEWEFDP